MFSFHSKICFIYFDTKRFNKERNSINKFKTKLLLKSKDDDNTKLNQIIYCMKYYFITIL